MLLCACVNAIAVNIFSIVLIVLCIVVSFSQSVLSALVSFCFCLSPHVSIRYCSDRTHIQKWFY